MIHENTFYTDHQKCSKEQLTYLCRMFDQLKSGVVTNREYTCYN